MYCSAPEAADAAVAAAAAAVVVVECVCVCVRARVRACVCCGAPEAARLEGRLRIDPPPHQHLPPAASEKTPLKT